MAEAKKTGVGMFLARLCRWPVPVPCCGRRIFGTLDERTAHRLECEGIARAAREALEAARRMEVDRAIEAEFEAERAVKAAREREQAAARRLEDLRREALGLPRRP